MAISIAKIPDSIFREYSNKNAEMLEEAILNGILLPDDATNGDVIKALFPNGIVLMTNSLGVGYKLNDSKKEGYMPWFDKDWWNAPYKVESEDKK